MFTLSQSTSMYCRDSPTDLPSQCRVSDKTVEVCRRVGLIASRCPTCRVCILQVCVFGSRIDKVQHVRLPNDVDNTQRHLHTSGLITLYMTLCRRAGHGSGPSTGRRSGRVQLHGSLWVTLGDTECYIKCKGNVYICELLVRVRWLYQCLTEEVLTEKQLLRT